MSRCMVSISTRVKAIASSNKKRESCNVRRHRRKIATFPQEHQAYQLKIKDCNPLTAQGLNFAIGRYIFSYEV